MTDHPTENIFAIISNNYYKLTVSEKKVADYVFAHKAETQYMSISELAEDCGVADATISRFCRRLKLKGYNDFKLAVAKAGAVGSTAVDQNKPVMPSVYFESEITENDDMAELCSKLYHAHVSGISQTMSILNLDSVSRAADLIDAADTVYCMGQGGSMVIAMQAEQIFSMVSPKFREVQDSHRQISYASLMNEKDVILFFSYSGSTKEIVDLIRTAHEQGAKVILVTRFLKSPGAKLADVVLQCGSNEGPLQLGSMTAKMAQLYIIDLLYNICMRRHFDRATENQEKIAEALATKHL